MRAAILTATFVLAAAPTAYGQGREWVFSSTDPDPFDDTQQFMASVGSADNVWVRLSVRCEQGETFLWFLPGESITDDDTKVLWRVDRGRTWEGDFLRLSQYPDALYAPDPISFARSLIGGEQLALGYFPVVDLVGKTRVVHYFSLAGADAAISQVANACGWKITP